MISLVLLSSLSLAAASVCSLRSSSSSSPQCNVDYCLRAVSDFSSAGAADCSSFFSTTVTPCVVTSTTATVVTITANPTTITNTATSQLTQYATIVDSVTSVIATKHDTIYIATGVEVDVTKTSYTTIFSSLAPVAKRDEAPPALLQNRAPFTTAAATCAATTGSPTDVPIYASACQGTADYSSACSCAGITAATTTLTASTTIITTTTTIQYTPTVTVSAVVTKTIPATTQATTIVPATYETTDASVIAVQTNTVTVQVTLPTTVAVQYCNTYKFVATSGNYNGQYISSSLPNPNALSYGLFEFNSDPTQALTFTLRPGGGLYANNAFGLAASPGFSQIYLVTNTTQPDFGLAQIAQITCAIQGTAPISNAAGMLSCNYDGSPTFLQTCTLIPQQYYNLVFSYDYYGSSCANPAIAAIFAGVAQC